MDQEGDNSAEEGELDGGDQEADGVDDDES